MNFFDPNRPSLPNGSPCWLSWPKIILPSITIAPDPGGDYRIQFPIPIGNFESRYIRKILSLEELADFLQEWSFDPERTLESWGIVLVLGEEQKSEPPKEVQPQPSPLSVQHLLNAKI